MLAIKMRATVSHVVPAPRERVWEWWIDFGAPGGEPFRVWHGNGWGTRTVTANDGRTIELSDHTPLAGAVTRRVVIEERYRFSDVGTGKQKFRSEWRFEDVSGDPALTPRARRGGRTPTRGSPPEPPSPQTRVVRDIEFPSPRAVKLLGPLGRALAARLIRRDLKAHCDECARELASGTSG